MPNKVKSDSAKELAAAEAALCSKYPNIILGSLREVSAREGKFHMKRSVQIECAFSGCATTRRIATSDLAQVSLCEEHTRSARLQRRREARAARKTQQPKKVRKAKKAAAPVSA